MHGALLFCELRFALDGGGGDDRHLALAGLGQLDVLLGDDRPAAPDPVLDHRHDLLGSDQRILEVFAYFAQESADGLAYRVGAERGGLKV